MRPLPQSKLYHSPLAGQLTVWINKIIKFQSANVLSVTLLPDTEVASTVDTRDNLSSHCTGSSTIVGSSPGKGTRVPVFSRPVQVLGARRADAQSKQSYQQ